jgi:hypothetical protein
VICQDPIFGAEVQAPCGHFYDTGCITNLFQSATRDESLYPPRCCRQIIPLPQVRSHLTMALLTEFEFKAREFGTLKRVYCATPTCSRFLGPLYEGYFSKVFRCPSPACTTATCGKCRGRYKGCTHNCTPDTETECILALSQASGWSRCPGCAQMIELNAGCFHMTCRCRTEFCYLCSARWKTCRCPQWDENRLLAAAERRVNTQLQVARRAQPVNRPQQGPAVHQPAPAAGDRPFYPRLPHLVVRRPPRAVNLPVVEAELMVRNTMEHLRVDHECQHTTWRYTCMSGRCEGCSMYLPYYLYVSCFLCLVYIETCPDPTFCSGVKGVKCSVVVGVGETGFESFERTKTLSYPLTSDGCRSDLGRVVPLYVV